MVECYSQKLKRAPQRALCKPSKKVARVSRPNILMLQAASTNSEITSDDLPWRLVDRHGQTCVQAKVFFEFPHQSPRGQTTSDMVVLAPLPKPRLPRRGHNCSGPRATKKRRPVMEILEINEELITALTRPSTPKVPLTATHEIRLLRAQVSSMETELQQLQTKWTRQLPDKRTLECAQQSIRDKHAATRAEQTHRELEQLLQHQQLLLATLQTAVLHAPLCANGKDIFDALHFNTQLGHDANERSNQLTAHCARSLATIPSLVDKAAQLAMDKALAHHGAKSARPVSQIDITGCTDCTLISSVFIFEIPHTSLDEVYKAVLVYFETMARSVHFDVDVQHTSRLNSPTSSVIYRRSTCNGAIVNNIVCSKLSATYGLVHIDAVTDDPMHPIPPSASSHYAMYGLTLTSQKESVPGQTHRVTLRWVVVYRYNMLPQEPAIRQELAMIRPVINGDLITASICGYLQHQHQRRRKGR